MAFFLALWLAEAGLEGLVSGCTVSLRAEAGAARDRRREEVAECNDGGPGGTKQHVIASVCTARDRRGAPDCRGGLGPAGLARVGAVSVGASLGNGPRGLQRRRFGLGLLPA